MNVHILENAAVYVNAYRSRMERNGASINKSELRSHVTRLFGAVYAAVLVA